MCQIIWEYNKHTAPAPLNWSCCFRHYLSDILIQYSRKSIQRNCVVNHKLFITKFSRTTINHKISCVYVSMLAMIDGGGILTWVSLTNRFWRKQECCLVIWRHSQQLYCLSLAFNRAGMALSSDWMSVVKMTEVGYLWWAESEDWRPDWHLSRASHVYVRENYFPFRIPLSSIN